VLNEVGHEHNQLTSRSIHSVSVIPATSYQACKHGKEWPAYYIWIRKAKLEDFEAWIGKAK